MEETETWTMTLVFRDPTGKKEVTEKLSFAAKEFAEQEITSFKGDRENKTGKIFRIQNEAGEAVEFRGHDWIRHTLKRDTVRIY